MDTLSLEKQCLTDKIATPIYTYYLTGYPFNKN